MASKRQQYRHLPAFILLMIAERPIHGNGIHALLVDRMGIAKLDNGAIYRTLKDLEDEGEVSFEWDTSESGPAKKVYHLTNLGWKKLEIWQDEIEMRIKQLQNYMKVYRAIKKPRKK